MRLVLLIVVLCGFGFGPVPAASAAPAYIVFDVKSGTVIEHRDANELWYPASVTKLMTAYLTFKALRAGRLRLTSPVMISANALSEPPSKMGYKVGTVLTVENALKMLIVKSANDIAVALAETVGGSEPQFVTMMNQEAQRLGMNSTRYKNPNGLPDNGQVTTARDLGVLARAIFLEYPEFRVLFQIPAIRAGTKVMRSHNTLLEHFRGTNGMKTGFICASGFNLVASATRNGRSLIVVVLGAVDSEERAEVAAHLLDLGFRGGSFKVARPKLASFGRSAATGTPTNMRDAVCGGRKAAKQRSPVLAKATSSALGPRFVTMQPVRVGTGGADSAPPRGGQPVANIPLPRPRPAYR